jgi:hypothetical protein
LTRRRAAAARAERPGDARAGDKAALAVRRQLCQELGITPSQAKQTTRLGRHLESLPVAGAALADGTLTPGHIGVIAEVTAHFTGDERDRFEAELVQLASECRDAWGFGHHARARLIEIDHDAALRDLKAKEARRGAAVTQTPDGTTLLRLRTAGYAGELLHTAIDAFRTPDPPGTHRSAEQRTHDALITALETALRTGTASTQHGIRPHVAVTIPVDALTSDRAGGVADTIWTGPLPAGALTGLLGDCTLTRILTDARSTPLEVSTAVRTVPAGLWKLLVVRDGGCIAEGCDTPPGWCQVAHLDVPYRHDGKLSPATAALLCTTGTNHHTAYDTGRLPPIVWTNGKPVIPRPSRPPPDP